MSRLLWGVAALALMPAAALADDADFVPASDEIIVTASAPDLSQQPKGQTLTSVTRDQFANQPAATIGEVLVMQPGVTVQGGNGPRDVSISVRGSNVRNTFGVRNVQVFEDGFPVTQPDGLARTDLTDPHAYARIDVAQGPSSALYGNYATGGAILFHTRRGSDLEGLEFGADAGDFGYRNFYGAAGGATAHLDGAAFISEVKGDGFTAHTAFDTTTENLIATYSPTATDRFIFKLINNELDADLSIRLSLDQFRLNPFQANCATLASAGCASVSVFTNGRNGAKQNVSAERAGLGRGDQRTIAGARWEHDFDTATTGRVQMIWDNRDISQPTSNTSSVGVFASYNIMADLTHHGLVFGVPANLQLGVWVNDEDNSSYSYNVTPAGGATLGALTRTIIGHHGNAGVRARAEFSPNAQLTLIAGVDAEQTRMFARQNAYSYPTVGPATLASLDADRHFFNVAPEISAGYQLNNSWQFHARASAGYGTPQLSNLFVTPAGIAGANLELNTQKNIGVDIGADYQLNDALHVSVAGFYEWFRDELVSQSAGANLLSYTFNAPKSEHRGLELAVDWRPLPSRVHGFNTHLAYMLNDQIYKSYVERLSAGAQSTAFDRADNKIPGVIPNYINARVGYEQKSGALQGFGAFVEVNFRDAYFLDNANLLKAPDYQIFNLNLHYDPQSGPLANTRLYIAAQNLTDETYIGSASNIADSISSVTGLQNGASTLSATTGSIYAGAPRTIMGGVRVKF